VARERKVARPIKRSEFSIIHASASAERGWADLCATMRNAMTDCWDFLTRTPQAVTPTNYPLKGALGIISRDGKTYQRWQHKPTLKGGARIWFYVHEQTVYLEQVHTHHPNETK
jgi:hypothetical protein